MTKITGNISVETDNILPIIKKWLYSEHEIFLRELVSNSFDAINKLKKISSVDKIKADTQGLINIQINEKAKTIVFSDNGLGLDTEEVQKYINQVAFSGAEDFIEKYKNKDEQNQIIGHFGLGFYSAFMVSDKVEIISLSYKKDAEAIHWSCDGSSKFFLESTKKKNIGTDVILHISDENKAYLKEEKITELVKKYANFLPVEIQVNGKKVNDQNPLWIKHSSTCDKKDYLDFYQKLFPFSQEPLFWIHLNIDYPFNLKGILYFPKLLHELDAQKGQVKLFTQQVYVTDNAKEVIPEFLTLLRGAIDCPEIPLNVSRSYLQNDPYVQKISKHIIKKVADKLNELYKQDKDSFARYWEDINPFIKYGMMHNQDFYEKVKDIVIFPSSTQTSTTIQDYLERNKDKNENKVLYCIDKEAQAAYVSMCKEQDLEVIFLNSVIDTHFLQFLESKDTSIKYSSIDSDLADCLIDKDKESKIVDPKDNKTANEKIEQLFKDVINKEKLKIKVEHLKTESVPAMILESEQMKRLKAMTMLMQGENKPDMFEDLTLIINSNNKIIQKITTLNTSGLSSEKVKELCLFVYDLAQMSLQKLSGDKVQDFISRCNTLLVDA
jgi:molecular chaperone HtpG